MNGKLEITSYNKTIHLVNIISSNCFLKHEYVQEFSHLKLLQQVLFNYLRYCSTAQLERKYIQLLNIFFKYMLAGFTRLLGSNLKGFAPPPTIT